MNETGIVLSADAEKATVRFERTEACKKCGACQLGRDGEMLLHVPNYLDAKPGDSVSVELAEKQLFFASIFAYGLPLVGLLMGLLIGNLVAPLFPVLPSDAVAALGAGIFTFIAFLTNHILEPVRQKRHKYQPELVSVQQISE